MNRREFLHAVAAAAVAGLPVADARALDFRRVPGSTTPSRRSATSACCTSPTVHAQLLPMYFREPSVNLGIGAAPGQPPHLVGEAPVEALRHCAGYRARPTRSPPRFRACGERVRRSGRLRASRHAGEGQGDAPGALLLDGGDTWQGSATSLWTRGQDMIDAQKLLGVDIMTGHWEFTYGAERVKEVVTGISRGASNSSRRTSGPRTSATQCSLRTRCATVNGVPVAVIGQAFPYTPIANPRYFVSDWTFGIQEEALQKVVDEARAKGAQAVVLLSHNGMDVDLKLASRVTGIDVILGGHTHDGVPRPTIVANRSGRTVVTNAGSNGKFLAVLDLDVEGRQGRRLPLSAAAGVQRSCCRRTARWPSTYARCARRSPQSSTKSSPSRRDCCIGAAVSTAPPTS